MGCFGGGGSSSYSGADPALVKSMSGVGQNWLNPENRDAAAASSFISPALFQQIGNMWGQQATGQYLDPSTNPALQRYMNAGQQASQRNLGTSLANLESQFAKAGQYSMGTNSPLLQAEKQAVQTSQQQLDETNAKALYDTYGQERGLQNLALSALQGWNQTPASMAQDFARASTTSSSSSSQGGGDALTAGLGLLAAVK
jgi:hypothetical protein